MFTIKEISAIPFISKIINKHAKNIKKFRQEIIINQIIRDLINLMVVDVIKTANQNLKKCKPKSINDIYQNNKLIVDFSEKMKIIDKQIKLFLKRNMYNHKSVLINTNVGKKVIKNLFDYLVIHYKKYINHRILKNTAKERAIADCIAGMTDRYAINLYNQIK